MENTHNTMLPQSKKGWVPRFSKAKHLNAHIHGAELDTRYIGIICAFTDSSRENDQPEQCEAGYVPPNHCEGETQDDQVYHQCR